MPPGNPRAPAIAATEFRQPDICVPTLVLRLSITRTFSLFVEIQKMFAGWLLVRCVGKRCGFHGVYLRREAVFKSACWHLDKRNVNVTLFLPVGVSWFSSVTRRWLGIIEFKLTALGNVYQLLDVGFNQFQG